MIRRAVQDDLPWLMSIAREFNAKYWDQELHEYKMVNLISTLVAEGTVLRSDTGVILGTVYEDPMRDNTVLVEIGWYSTGSDGMKLLAAFVQEGKKLGVDEIRMSTLECNNKVGALLERNGFKPLETSYSLRLGD